MRIHAGDVRPCRRCFTVVVTFVLLLLAFDAHSQGRPEALVLSGPDWSIHAEDPRGGDSMAWAMADLEGEGWVPARVPGNIQSDLEAARLLTPHWYGAGDERIWEVAEQAWWYCKDIDVPATYAGRRLTLVFNGVDPMCEVFVNGTKVGEASGMYRRLHFDVTDAILPGQSNRVSVRIPAIPEGLTDYHRMSDRTSPLQASDPQGRDYYPNGIDRVRRTLQDLKSPTNFGWDWGVCIWTMGIWKEVTLEATGPARIDWTRVQVELTEAYTQAEVDVGLEINTPQAMSVRAVVQLIGPNAPAAAVHEQALSAGENLLNVTVSIDEPALWWPNGQGERPLYTAEVTLYHAETGEVLDVRRERFGIREVRWEQVEGAPDDFINPYQLVINGRPVRMMGSNLIPPDLMFGRIMERGPLLLRRAQAAGMNTLRVWGGGVILPEAMYRLADELGIMLSQEFPLANAWPETDDVFLGNLETTITSIIKQTRNHPSIIEWSGGNEMPWQQGTEHAALQVLERLVATHDDRIFRATCPIQGSHPHGPWTFDPGNRGSALAYNDGYQYYNGLTQMRHGEFGAPSPSNLESWYRTIPPELHDVENHLDHRVIRRKKVVYAVFAPNLWLNLPQIDYYFGPADGLPMTVASGQFLGAQGLRYAMDSHRQRGDRMGGFMSWNFNEPWPNGAGSFMIDYDGRPLMNFDFVRQALAPVALSLRHNGMRYARADGIHAELILVSDAPQTHTHLTWRWVMRDRRGAVVADQSGTTDAHPRQVQLLDRIEVVPPAETALGPFFVELSLSDAAGQRVYERLHVFVSDETSAGLRGMLCQDTEDQDDDGQQAARQAEQRVGPRNLAYVGNGAKPATADSAYAQAIHQPAGLNDGVYGNASAWIGAEDGASFTIQLAQVETIGKVLLGRDRTGGYADRNLGALLIEVSTDGQQWQAAAEVERIHTLSGRSLSPTLCVRFPAVEASYVRVTAHAHTPHPGHEAAIDEFEVYAPDADAGELETVHAAFTRQSMLFRPVTRAAVTVQSSRYEVIAGQEKLTLSLHNGGEMTALYCTAHPMLVYRTDLLIENNNLFIPPGESRTITITADRLDDTSVTLAQLGWQVRTWNAETVSVPPSGGVLVAMGRVDGMCMEFRGALNSAQRTAMPAWSGVPGQPAAADIAYRLTGGDKPLEMTFAWDASSGATGVSLHLATADRSANGPVRVEVGVNGHAYTATLPEGYGLQAEQPEHLAQPAAAVLSIPADVLAPGQNTVTLRVLGEGWLTWDAIAAIAHGAE